MKDILFIHDYPPTSGGGVEVNTFNLAKELSGRGYGVTILTSRLKSESFSGEGPSDPDVQIVVGNSRERIIAEVCRHVTTVVMCTFSLREAMMTALAVMDQLGIEHFAYLRTSYSHISFSRLAGLPEFLASGELQKFIDLLGSQHCQILGVSASSQRTLGQLGVSKTAMIIHPGVLWSELPLVEKEPVYDLCYIGEIAPNKGVYMLPLALALLKRQFPKVRMVLIGQGDHTVELKSQFELLGLSENVEFAGYLSRAGVCERLSRSKVLVHPSFSESWGNVVVEALGLAREVVVSARDGLLESSALSPLSYTFTHGDLVDLVGKVSLALEVFPKRGRQRWGQAWKVRAQTTISRQADELLGVISSKRRLSSKEVLGEEVGYE